MVVRKAAGKTKKTVKPETVEPPAKEPERVTVVTEVVEDFDQSAAASEKTTSITTSADDEGVGTYQAKETSEVWPGDMPIKEDTAPPAGEEGKRKEIVEQLFKPPEASSIMPEISEHKKGSSRLVLIWSIIVIVAALVIGGGLIYGSEISKRVGSLAAKPKPTPTLAPTPTVAAPSRADITIEVLNGGGVPGAAGKMKTFLEDKGYKVGSTGNADAYTFDETQIDVKSGKEAYLKLLQTDLSSDYTIGTATATLAADATADARVIVGKK